MIKALKSTISLVKAIEKESVSIDLFGIFPDDETARVWFEKQI